MSITANNAKSISQFQACTAPKGTDLMIMASANVVNSTVTQYTTKTSSKAQFLADVVVSMATPSNTNVEAYPVGKVIFDTSSLYVVVANNVIKKVSLSVF